MSAFCLRLAAASTVRVTILPVSLCLATALAAQTPGAASLPATAPTQRGLVETTAPLAATNSGAPAGQTSHTAQVTCANGQLEIRAEDSSLNQILRAVSRCTGMHITGGVSEQRVYGNYGPASPATVLATLLDGTGSNMLLQETAADQPAQLILTPRVGSPTPPAQAAAANADHSGDDQDDAPPQQNPYTQPGPRPFQRTNRPMGMQSPPVNTDQANGYSRNGQVPQGTGQDIGPGAAAGSAVTSPESIPQSFNNVNGNPNNTSPTASTYPTTNSVPLDSVATPSTTPSSNGIVDAPNPPAAGSDTAAALDGAPKGTPGTTNISPDSTSTTTTPGATNTTVPANTTGSSTPSTLTPEQVFQQLQQRMQQQQQQQSQQ